MSINSLVMGAAIAGALASPAARAEPADVPLLFVADSQVHNAYGTALKQMFPIADWVSRVAVRPPEVNLLAPLTLRHALKTGQDLLPPGDRMVFVLGDGTNIGCSGEADVFDGEFTRPTARPDTLRLMVHGNHDSYMMGTVNSYGPKGPNTWTPGKMMKSNLPVDEAFWNPAPAPAVTGASGVGRNWLDACFKPNGKSAAGTPMNKVRWLARYAASLRPHGLVEKPDGLVPDDGRKFVGTAKPGSALASLNYRSRGIWFPPSLPKWWWADYSRSWKSFVVQAVDVSDQHTVVLIDTSVCETARGGRKFLGTNSGMHSCIGPAQFEEIEALVRDDSTKLNVIFAGHFPLKDLEPEERDRLIGIMGGKNPSGWTYVSGHTHDPWTDTPYPGGTDRNIGSTTDWPMESHVIRLDATSSKITDTDSLIFKDQVPPLDYSLRWDLTGSYSELCRHFGAAKALAEKSHQFEAPWVSPEMNVDQCKAIQADWTTNAGLLAQYQERISQRFDDEPDYHAFILRVAAGASLYESKTRVTGRIP